MDQHPIQRGEEILLVASCYRKQDKLRPDGPLDSYADFTYLPFPEINVLWVKFKGNLFSDQDRDHH